MFEIGFWELLLIVVMTLIIVGPEKLPGAAKTAGRWFGKARRFIEGVKSDVEKEFDVTELKRMLHNQEVQINELTQKLDNPNILDEEIESITSSVYSIDDEETDDKNADEKDDSSADLSQDKSDEGELKSGELKSNE